MILNIDTPTGFLRNYVKQLIFYKGYTGDKTFEKLLPDGSTQLIVELDGNKRKRADSPATYLNSWITGIQTQPVTYRSEQNATTLCIQFEPGGLFALTGIPVNEFQNAMVETEVFSTFTINELRDQLLKESQPQVILSTTKKWLINQLLKTGDKMQFVVNVQSELHRGNTTTKTLSQRFGYSQKQFIHRFKQHMGVAPKQYLRLLRFNKALNLLQADTVNYSEVTFQCGYYDQAHFINEFSRFTGYSPTEYHGITKDYPHVIAIDGER